MHTHCTWLFNKIVRGKNKAQKNKSLRHASANLLVTKQKEINCFQCLVKQTIKITTFVNQGEAKKPCHYWKNK